MILKHTLSLSHLWELLYQVMMRIPMFFFCSQEIQQVYEFCNNLKASPLTFRGKRVGVLRYQSRKKRILTRNLVEDYSSKTVCMKYQVQKPLHCCVCFSHFSLRLDIKAEYKALHVVNNKQVITCTLVQYDIFLSWHIVSYVSLPEG